MPDTLIDPVTAYDRIAPAFAELAERRRDYLNGIERLIIAAIPAGARSLLDVGAGDGSRSRRIAQSSRISDLTLIEPSVAMQGNSPARTMRAEDLHLIDNRFDVILCLWNVVGHIFPAAARTEALRQFARLLTPRGRAFADVNHRYNARHYGPLPTASRFLRDQLSWSEGNGDIDVTWNAGGVRTATRGHVFTHREIRSLCQSAGLNIERRFVVDYATGQRRRWGFEGQLLYVLTPAIAA